MTALKLSEDDKRSVRSTLESYPRSTILEVYFDRIDGRTPDTIADEIKALYEIDLKSIRTYLIGQHPQDPILTQLFKLMN